MKRYRTLDDGEILTAFDLDGAVGAYTDLADKPNDPRLPEGEWYCQSEDCAIRGVRIDAKYLDGPPPKSPPRMCCPACHAPMYFHGYRERFTLIPERNLSLNP